MNKENIIDLTTYRQLQEKKKTDQHRTISKDLELAIKHLIQQLRELGPIQQQEN